ncbi:sugar transferase [Pedobacter sp. HMF7056]|uniref:Sugar transferase n=2 Tax=Hufsiella ginkgonis TaxID=2695274 RepID=A0A7K1XX64_9SPHI|nr:sugar transferase [Hufsiella ginkgonis]
MKASVVYAGSSLKNLLAADLGAQFRIQTAMPTADLNTYLSEQSLLSLPDIILIETDPAEECFKAIGKIRKNPLLQGLIIVLVSGEKRNEWKQKAFALKVHDYYTYPFPTEDLCERLNFLVKFRLIKPRLAKLSEEVDVTYKTPTFKRYFDILASGCALLVLSPIFLIVAIVIRLESKGKIIYKSKRVGTGYKIFDFYKFRSMRSDADKMLASMASLNQYDDVESADGKSAFVKIKNDPRITKVGNFIRRTSIDELPQLVNVFKGDMSLVGNRPLPLYEAEMLTSNEWSMRFLGPAGLTGLWQISKRGQKEMSERERKKLDNFYAINHSFWLDMKIIIGTIPALLQKEKV